MTAVPDCVVVIGGGIFGASTSLQLARRGVKVTLLTDGPLAAGASGRSLAWLNSAGHRSLAYHHLRISGIDRWRSWAAHAEGGARAIRFSGGLTWAPEGASFRAQHEHEQDLGYDSMWLTPEEVGHVVPGVNPSAIAQEGAIFNPGEGWVDLPTVILHLTAELRAYGGSVIENSGLSRAVIEDGRAVGAVTGDGTRIEADAVVVATGPDVPGQLAELGIRIGNDSPAAFVAFTKPVETELQAVLNTPRVAVRRTIDGGLALDSAWSEERIEVGEEGKLLVADEVVHRLLEEASHVLTGNPELELDHVGIGYKPIPGGGEPVIGGVESVPGLYVGFSHSGATLGLLVGELLAGEIVDGKVSPLLKTFRPSRYGA